MKQGNTSKKPAISNAQYSMIVIGVVIILMIAIVFLLLPDVNKEILNIEYPYNGSMFPPEISAPTFRWEDSLSGADMWHISIVFPDGGNPMKFVSDTREWSPSAAAWEEIKKRSTEKEAVVTIVGKRKSLLGRIASRNAVLSENTVKISTSADSVGAPIFFRDVVLPFEFAREKMELIKWRLGDISSNERPPVVFENLPLCGNCHSFPLNGSHLAMDIDFGGDKGSYVVAPIEEQMYLSRDKIISWSDYKADEGHKTFGFLAQISPTGKYVAAQIKDRVVSFVRDDLYFSQLFFPVRGIIAIYNNETGNIQSLPGADNFEEYVHANPSWSPDEKYLLVARAPLPEFIKKDKTDNLVLTNRQTALVLGGEEYLENPWERRASFKFNLYRIPFNDGKGGEPEPVPGASHNNKSNYFPKYSPDGKWIVFCQADNYMLLQPDSKLCIMPSDFSAPPRVMNCNMELLNSWHSWSPNSRWIVFSSKKNGPYTDLFLTHVDENGVDAPPVLLEHFSSQDRACNIPEFVNIAQGGIQQIHETFIDYYSYIRKGDNCVSFEKYEEAESAYRHALELKPDSPIGHRNLASLLLMMNRRDEAEKELQIAIELDPKETSNYYNLGLIAIYREDFETAKKQFEAALEIDPKFAPALEGLGLMYTQMGDSEKAKEYYTRAVEMDPALTLASYNLAREYLAEKDYKNAEKYFRSVLTYDVDFDAYRRLGLIYYLQEEFDKAEAEFLTILKIDSDNFTANLDLGLVYMQKGEYSNAEKYLRKALQINKDVPDAHIMLADALVRMNKDLNEAASHYLQGLQLNPNNVQAMIKLGDLYARTGRLGEAVSAYQEALKFRPNDKAILDKIQAIKDLKT